MTFTADDYYKLGDSLAQRGEHARSVDAFFQYIQLTHKTTGLVQLLNIGANYARQKRFEAAVAVLRFGKQRIEALGSSGPTYVSVCRNLGRASKSIGLVKEAMHAFRIAVDLDPSCADHAVELALCYYERGDMAKALATLLRARHAQPESYRLHYCLGVCYADAKDYKHAWEQYDILRVLKPEFATALKNKLPTKSADDGVFGDC